MRAKSYPKNLAILIALGVAMGCGASVNYVNQAQLMVQKEARENKIQVQQQLLTQASRTSLLSYQDYQVGPEDLLEIQVFGHDSLSRQVRVNGQGLISLPLVGEVQVADLSPQDIEKRLIQAYGSEFIRNPQVSVSVKEYRHQRVAVTGAVDKPGQYEMIGPRTLLEMLALAGGLQDKPGAKAGDVVHVIRNQSASQLARSMKVSGPQRTSSSAETIVVDLRHLLQKGAVELNIPILHGDVIYVPLAGSAYVLGGVMKPGSVAVSDNLTLTQAVALAGGLDPVLATRRVDIMRLNETGKPVTITTNLNRIMAREEVDVSLKDNDVVVVGESSVRKALFVFKELLPGAMGGAYRFAPK